MRKKYFPLLMFVLFLYIGPVNILPYDLPPNPLKRPLDNEITLEKIDSFSTATSVSDVIEDDGNDLWWWYDYDPAPSWTKRATDVTFECKHIAPNFIYYAMLRFQLDVPQGATITNASITAYETEDTSGAQSNAWIKRINEDNVTNTLESDTTHPIWANDTYSLHIWDSVASEWHTDFVVALVQEQVDLETWQEGNWMGFVFGYDAAHTGNGKWEDNQAAGTNHAYINVTYTLGGAEEETPDWLEGSRYRNSHVIQQTIGADVNHTVPIEVYLGSGLPYDNKTYLDNQAQGGLDDIRFTNTTNYELEYYLESYYYGGDTVDYFTDDGSDFTWYSRNYPTTMYHKNRTYITYMGSGYDPYIVYYDHENGTWSPSYRVGTNPLSNDAHGSPAIYIDNADYVHVIFGAHNSAFKHSRGTNPLQINSWTELSDIGTDDQSYASVAYDPITNNVYIWYRYLAGAGVVNMGFRNSTDGGVTWGDHKNIVNAGTNQWPYKAAGGIDPNDNNILHITWQSYNATENSYYQDVRYMYYNLTDTHCYNVSGADLGIAVDVAVGTEWQDVLAYDSNSLHVTDSIVKVDENSYPYIVFATMDGGGGRDTWLYYWSGAAWVPSEICDSGAFNTATDFAIYSSTNISAYVNKDSDITRYSWNGVTWTEEETIMAATEARGGRHLTYSAVPLTRESGVGYFQGNDTLLMSFTEEDSGNVGTNVRGFSWGIDGFVQRTAISGAKFWVKIPGNLSESDYTLYIYYGNSTQVTTSNFFSTSTSPIPNHGTWNQTEAWTVTNTTAFSISSFAETMGNNHLLYFDNETQGFYFAEDGVSLSDWTYSDSAPTTDGDVMSLHVLGDDAFDYFVCNDTSMPAGYYYLEYYLSANATTGTPYITIYGFSEDGAQGSSTLLGTLTPTTSFVHGRVGVSVDHTIESIRIGARAPSADIEFMFDWLRFTNETGWQHDGSTTWGCTVSGAGSIESDGEYLSLTSAGWSYFDFYLDDVPGSTVNTALDISLYPFLEVNFHEDDADEWYYMLVYDSLGYHAIRQTLTNWAIDYHWSAIGSDASDLARIRISFTGTKTIRLDYIKLYFIANFTLEEYGRNVDGSAYVENSNLVFQGNHSNYFIFNFEPDSTFDPNAYSHIEVNRTASQNVLLSYYQNAAWTEYNRHRMIEVNTGVGSATDFRFKVSNVGTIYSIRFGNDTWTESAGEYPAPPINSASPVCTNLDDSTFLYAWYRQYIITANVTDSDGYTDIATVDMTLYSNGRGTSYWTIRYTQDTDTFSEYSDTNNMITLNVSGSSAASSGNDIDLTIILTVHWNHTDLTDTDTLMVVTDDSLISDSDFYETDWDFETRLNLTSYSLNDGSGTADRGDYDTIGGITASGTVTYLGSLLHPASDQVDVWVRCTNITGSPWSDFTLTSGNFSMLVDSDDEIGLDIYSFIVVEEGAGVDGVSLLDSAKTDTYISDRIIFDIQADDESPINGQQVNFTLTATYAYDGSTCTTYKIVIFRSGLWWYTFIDGNVSLFVDSATDTTYNYTTNDLINDTVHGITKFTTNTETVTWSPEVTTTTTTTTPTGENYFYWFFYELFLSLEVWGIFGPLGVIILGAWMAQKSRGLGLVGFIVQVLFVSFYADLIIAGQVEYVWHMLLILLGGIMTCLFPTLTKQ